MTIATNVAANPTTSEIRPPCISRLSMSIPPSSQPSQCRGDGGAYTRQVCWVTLYGEMYGAARDNTMKKMMIPRPTTADLRSRRTRRKNPPRCSRGTSPSARARSSPAGNVVTG